jgi:PAS domain S-box-containing protein
MMKGRATMGETVGVPAERDGDALLRGVLATAVDQAILAVDGGCRVTLANGGAERLLGYPAGGLVGRHLATFVLPGPDGSEVAGFEQLLAGDDAAAGRLRTLVRADGTELRVLLSVGALCEDDGKAYGAVLVAWEIHGERRAADAMRRAFEREHSAAERLRELSRIKDDFVANVSHELRTPLTTVVGNTEMLLDGDAGELSGPQRRLLGAIERNARRLQRLVGDLLMLSRIQGGKVTVSAAPVVVQDVVRVAVAAAEQRADQAVHLDVELPAEPLVVDGDAEDLARMVGNVLGNALKFTPAGGSVTVRLDAADGFARVEIADTGIGIPKEEIGSVFDGFFRSSRSQRNESPGPGLGLTIAQSIANRHSGTIAINAREPAGTVVEIRLPVRGGDQHGLAS